MLVSVVMAARNAEATIREAIRSVLAQTHRDWELIVVDDGSSDATADAVRAFRDERIRLLGIEYLGVLGQVRNRGIDAARGDSIALLDADDLWRPEKLESQLRVFEARPAIGVVHTDAELLVGGTLRLAPSPPRPGPLVRRLLERNFVFSSSALIRRTLLDEHGSFDEDPELRGAPDYELWLRLAPHTQFAYVREPLTIYRVHDSQMTADMRWTSLGTLCALEKHPRPQWDYLRAIGIARSLAGKGGRRELLRALRHRPWDVRGWRFLLRSLGR